MNMETFQKFKQINIQKSRKMRRMNQSILILILATVVNVLPNKYELLPAIPETTLSCKEEVAYIYQTDQTDRTQYILDTLNFDIDVLNFRDSLRLTRIIELDKKSCFDDYDSYYKAAYIYLHTGGINMKNDSLYFMRSSELFKKASDATTDIAKAEGATNMAKMAHNFYLKISNPQEAEESLFGTITDANFFTEPANLDSFRTKMRAEIKNKFAGMGIPLSDEQINQSVEETITMMKSQLEAAIRSAKQKAKDLNKKQK